METMNDTPETDGEWNRLACQDHPEFERNLADFARKLERERDEARKEAEHAKAYNRKLKEENDKMRDAIRNLRDVKEREQFELAVDRVVALLPEA